MDDVKAFASDLKETIQSIREKQGIEVIRCDNLIAYLNEIITSSTAGINSTELEKYRAELQLWVEQNKSVHTSNLEMFRSVILMGQNALKSAFLMNGGATVALLAFLGKLSEQHQDKIPIFANSLLIFVVGILCIVMAYGSTYVSQMFYSDPKYTKIGFYLHLLVVLLVIMSYAFFMWGSCTAYKAFIGFV